MSSEREAEAEVGFWKSTMENEPVVDADPAWETSKENLQPVKVGRSATALKQATGLVSSDHQVVREATDAFEAQRK